MYSAGNRTREALRLADHGFGAYVPDLPGCLAVGETEDEVRQLIAEAITLHLESLRNTGEPIPPPASRGDYVDVAAPAPPAPVAPC